MFNKTFSSKNSTAGPAAASGDHHSADERSVLGLTNVYHLKKGESFGLLPPKTEPEKPSIYPVWEFYNMENPEKANNTGGGSGGNGNDDEPWRSLDPADRPAWQDWVKRIRELFLGGDKEPDMAAIKADHDVDLAEFEKQLLSTVKALTDKVEVEFKKELKHFQHNQNAGKDASTTDGGDYGNSKSKGISEFGKVAPTVAARFHPLLVANHAFAWYHRQLCTKDSLYRDKEGIDSKGTTAAANSAGYVQESIDAVLPDLRRINKLQGWSAAERNTKTVKMIKQTY